jgi:hypothetical protein
VEIKREGKKEVTTMTVEFAVAIAVAVPIILFPVAFVWYLNIGGMVQALKAKKAKAVAEKA